MTTNEMSPADIRACTCGNDGGNGSGWGGAWGEWILVFLIFAIFGWGGFGGNGFGGFGGGGGAAAQGALTREQACIDNNFQNLMRETAGIADSVNLGFANLNSTICNQQYDTARMINGLEGTIQGGFNAANVVALTNQNALQAQIAQCCCDQRIGQMQLGNQMEQSFCNTNYNNANNTTAIIQNAHNDTDRVLAKLDAMEMSRKDETIADLRTKLAACGDQTTAQYIINQLTGIISPRAVPAYPASSPCGLGNWAPQVLANSYNYNNGCGCGCGNF